MISLLTDLAHRLFEFYRLPLLRTNPMLALVYDRFYRCTPDRVCRNAVARGCVTLRYFHFSTISLLAAKQKTRIESIDSK